MSDTSDHLRLALPPGANALALAVWLEGTQAKYRAETQFPSMEYPAALLMLIALDRYRKELRQQFAEAFKIDQDSIQLHMMKLGGSV